VFFESGCRLERIEESAFARSKLRSIEIPSSVIVLGKLSFAACASLESVTFANDCRLERIGASTFGRSGLKSIEIPSSDILLRESRLAQPASLDSSAPHWSQI
jgi:hypothetical protein